MVSMSDVPKNARILRDKQHGREKCNVSKFLILNYIFLFHAYVTQRLGGALSINWLHKNRVLERRAPERCAPERRSECRSDGRSGAPQIELERYPERRSEKGRSASRSAISAPALR